MCVRWLHYFDLLKIRLFFFFRKNWNDTTTNQKLRYGLIICKYVNVVKTWSNLYIMQFLWFDGRIHLLAIKTITTILYHVYRYLTKQRISLFIIISYNCENIFKISHWFSPRFLCRPMTFFDLLWLWDVRELYIRKAADLPLHLLVGTFPCFVAIGFYFLSETPLSEGKMVMNE